jgi:hypothetical protein
MGKMAAIVNTAMGFKIFAGCVVKKNENFLKGLRKSSLTLSFFFEFNAVY